MSVGLLYNSLKAWFYGTFAPSGSGSLGPSDFYPVQQYVVLHSRPTDFCQAVWLWGSQTAAILGLPPLITIDVQIGDLGAMLTPDGRKTVFQVIQNLIDGIDRGRNYIEYSAYLNINTITLNTEQLSGTTPIGGYHNPGTWTIGLDCNQQWNSYGPAPVGFWFDITYTALIIHEFKHAADTMISPPPDRNTREQRATIPVLRYLRDVFYARPDDRLVGGYQTLYDDWVQYYIDFGGNDPQWYDIEGKD